MKYSIIISLSNTKFGPIVFKGNVADNIIKAAGMGYDGIELAIRDPKVIKIENICNLLDKYKLKVSSIGTGQIYCEEGLSLSDSDKIIRGRAVRRIKKIIDTARHFNASIIIGGARGNVKDLDNFKSELEKAEIRISQCLQELLSYSERHSQIILIEPANRYEINIFNRIDEVDSFLNRFKDKLDLERIGILADTFHMNIEEPVIAESFKRYSHLIKHVHFADSNRWSPGYGHINFKIILKVLKNINYDGFISFEILPMPNPYTAASAAINNIKKLEQ